MFLASCKETSVQENASVNVEEETKLVVDVKYHFSLRVPKDWFVKKFDTKMDFVTYNIDGQSGHIFLYIGNHPQSHLYWNGSLSVGKVVSVGTRDDFDFGGASDAPYKVHMMAMGTTSVNSVLYFEFSYNPQNSDTVACEKVITSLQYLKEAPADAENVIDVIQYGRRDKLAMKDILCIGKETQKNQIQNYTNIRNIEIVYENNHTPTIGKIVGLLRMSYEEVIRMYYDTKMYKEIIHDDKARANDEELIRQKGITLFDEYGLITLFKSYFEEKDQDKKMIGKKRK